MSRRDLEGWVGGWDSEGITLVKTWRWESPKGMWVQECPPPGWNPKGKGLGGRDSGTKGGGGRAAGSS